MGDNPYKEIKTKAVGIPDIYEKEIPSTVRSLPQCENKSFLFIPSLLLITLYLSLSICLTFYQKWVLKTAEYPLTIVMYHLISKFLLATIVRYISKQFNYRKVPNVHIFTSAKMLAPAGLASGIDIGFSNWGLGLVTISLYTMTKSTTIIFILFFAILLGLEKFASTLLVIVAMIAGGLLMFTYKSTSFDIFGFSFLLFASMASGVRWSFAQMIMSSTKLGLHNPIDMMFYVQPWMFLSLMPFMLGFEGPKLRLAISYFNLQDFYYILCKISFGGLLAFVMEISEYLVLSHTSSLTLSITGIFKEICQLILAVEINGDNLSFFNIIGLIFCLGGICCHVIHKYLILVSNENTIQMEFNERNKLTRKTTSSTPKQKVPLLNAENASDSDSDELTSDDKIKNSDIIFDILKRRDSKR